MNASIKRALLLACPLLVAPLAAVAAPPSSSAYVTDVQNSHVEDATSDGIGQVNMIVCIMSALRPEALVNQGPYNALVQEAKCDKSASSGGGASSSAGSDAAAAPNYMTAVVNATRASNTNPMVSKIWLTQEEEGKLTAIDVHISATAAPTASNPYGIFKLYYCGHEPSSPTCRMNGALESSDNGVRYFHTETRDDGQGPHTEDTALQLNASSSSTGSGRLLSGSGQNQSVFNFAYDANLYSRTDGNDTQCFSRDAGDPETGMSVWRYGLYDETSGDRVTLHSGFPIDFSHSGTTYHGYLGYYGLSMPADAMAALQNGDTIQKVDYAGGSTPTRTDYTVLKAPGRLMKFTRQARTLRQIDGVRFYTMTRMDGPALFVGAQANTQYEVFWDEAAGTFQVSGQMSCGGENGCQSITLPNRQPVSPGYWHDTPGIQAFSPSLGGGDVFIALQGATGSVDSGSVQVIYRVQDLVYPADMAAIGALYCVSSCPTAASMETYFAQAGGQGQGGQGGQGAPNTPFVAATATPWLPVALADVVSYSVDAQTALLKNADQSVVYTNADALHQNPMYQWGVRSGRLFTNLAAAECSHGSNTFCDWKVNDQSVYYQWETGAESHNQFAAVKDSSGHFVTFDAPLQVNFQVPGGTAFGDFAGQSMVLQYGGFGDLWGIPGKCVSRLTNLEQSCDQQESRYVPAFVIPYSTTTGRVTTSGHTYLVKWLDREIRFAKKPTSACAVANLTAPTGITLPTSAVLKDPSNAGSDVYLGTKPTVTSAPRVIHGEVKY